MASSGRSESARGDFSLRFMIVFFLVLLFNMAGKSCIYGACIEVTADTTAKNQTGLLIATHLSVVTVGRNFISI